ncbi:MAG: ATP-binding protein [Methanolinea sp.]|nr:ATP-binding protein [Methanolinea sp.]
MIHLDAIETQDNSKWRLIGTSVLSYRFVVPHDETVYVGDIVKVQDRKKGLVFFARVTDLVHESNFADEKWDTRPYSGRFYNLGEDVFIGVEAFPLGYVDARGKFHKPRTVPTKFSPVDYPSGDDLGFLSTVMGDIEVGAMRTGQDVLAGVPVKIHSSVLPQHMGVFATTGMGKSNFMKVFCASCMQARKFGLLVVDPHGEYLTGGQSSTGEPTRGLTHVKGLQDGLAVFTTRPEEQRRLYRASSLSLEYDDMRASDLSILYDLSDPQRDILEALGDYKGGTVIGFFSRLDPEEFTPTTYQALQGTDRDIAYRLRTSNPGPLRVIKRRLENLVKGNRNFFREKGSCIPDILAALRDRKVVLVDIPGMSERSEIFVLSVLTRVILEAQKEQAERYGAGGNAGESAPAIIVAIEEAQRVLGAGGQSTQVFRECAMEGRKFGVGLCVITQQPKNIDPKVLAQINTFVIMGLGDRGDRETIASSAKQDLSRMDTEIQTLDRGEAIISSFSIPFPVSTRIHKFEDYIERMPSRRDEPLARGLATRF